MRTATSSKVIPVSGTSWNFDLLRAKSMGPPMGPMGPPPLPLPARRNRKNRPPKAMSGNSRLPGLAGHAHKLQGPHCLARACPVSCAIGKSVLHPFSMLQICGLRHAPPATP